MTADATTPTLTGARSATLRAAPAPLRGHLPLGEPAGTPDRIEVTSAWLERDGEPWFPVTGEIHYSRLPRERWSQVLGHAKAGGLDSVATYVFWQAHEPRPGEFRWEDNLDLRAFITLAAQHGLDVVVRVGPWAHGEARSGGFPDWLLSLDLPTRTDDPQYLALVRRLYSQIVTQLAGLTHVEGGPVVGVQVENELYDQPQHLATLRTMLTDLGLQVPLWTATGWGGAQVPPTLLPVYSAYADGFWEDTTTAWPPFAAFHFRYSPVRDDLTVGKDLREALDGVVLDPATTGRTDHDTLPFATCELGGGMHVAYHRRPMVTPEDVTALALAKIGSGSVWQGYYMYAGGTQRTGPSGTEQESQATGYPNDVPTRTYDFNAPVGEHGQIRPHHHTLRRQHLWLQADPAVATMPAHVGGGSEDPAELRWSVRSDGQRGYLFLTTYQPLRQPIQAQPGVQAALDLEGATITVPATPVDLPAGVSVAWPLRYPLTDGLVLRSATAQLLTRVAGGGGDGAGGDGGEGSRDSDVVVLVATPGVPVELVLDGDVEVRGEATVTRSDDATVVRLDAVAGPGTVLALPGVRVLVVDERTADRLYRLQVAGRERLVVSDMPVYALDGQVVGHSEEPVASISIFPPVTTVQAEGAEIVGELAGAPGAAGSFWQTLSLAIPAAGTHRLLTDLRPVATDPPVPVTGGPMGRLSAPTDYSGAAQVDLDIPAGLVDGVDRALLRTTWTGDVARAVVGGEVVSDPFWHGRVWDVDLTQHRDALRQHGLRLELLPWRAATGVWVDPAVRDVGDGITIASVDVVRVARVVLTVV